MEKKLDGNYTRMLRALLSKSWRQHPTKQQLYGHLPLVTKTIKIRQTRHVGHCWRSRDELVSDVLLWTPSEGRTKAGCPARTYIQQLCADPRCSPEDLPKAIDDREGWRERVRNIRADSATWWWWNLWSCFTSTESLEIAFFLANYPHPLSIYIYVYIYCHPQTDCFVVSQLFSVARHIGLLQLGSKPAQLYVTLSLLPLSQQANHVSSRIIRH